MQPDDILVTTGASEAIIMTLDCITNEGDELIIPEPFYANYDTFAAACGVKVGLCHRQLIVIFHYLPLMKSKQKSMQKHERFLFVIQTILLVMYIQKRAQ